MKNCSTVSSTFPYSRNVIILYFDRYTQLAIYGHLYGQRSHEIAADIQLAIYGHLYRQRSHQMSADILPAIYMGIFMDSGAMRCYFIVCYIFHRFIITRLWRGGGEPQALVYLLGFAINSHQAKKVGIDQPQTRICLKLSDAETSDWRLNTRHQTTHSGDYWREANNLSSVCE